MRDAGFSRWIRRGCYFNNLTKSLAQSEAFTLAMAGLKAPVEYSIHLNLVQDRFLKAKFNNILCRQFGLERCLNIQV